MGIFTGKQIKIYVDDLRPKPAEFNVVVRSTNEAKKIIEEVEKDGGEIVLISLDHDAGDFEKDGGDFIHVLDFLVERETFYPIAFHTANPVGRATMQRMIDRFWP